MGANLLSVNGQLRSMYDAVPPVADHSTSPYEPVGIGKPLLMQYLRFRLRYEDGNQQLMLSTFFKATATKQAASEAINLFDPRFNFPRRPDLDDAGIAEIVDFGGSRYGHPLAFYTKSYTGLPLAMTTRMMDLNKSESGEAVIEALKGATTTIASIPMFMEFLPYVAIAKAGLSLLGKLFEFLTRDRPIFEDHDLDLQFDTDGTRRLQCGRIVCVPRLQDDDILGSARKFRLTNDNRLVDAQGHEFLDSSYFVLLVDSRERSAYEDFDHFQGAAELLKKTNRQGPQMSSIVSDLVDVLKGSNDVKTIQRIEKLALNGLTDDEKKEAEAIYKLISPEMAELFKTRFRQLVPAS